MDKKKNGSPMRGLEHSAGGLFWDVDQRDGEGMLNEQKVCTSGK